MSASEPSPAPLPGNGVSGSALEDHARALAHAHVGAARPRARAELGGSLRRLAARFEAAERALRAAADEPRMAGVAEWVLDNGHIVRQALREVSDDVPARFERQLSRLGDGASTPRVAALAREIADLDPLHLELDRATAFVLAYQEVAPLAMGELWALPAFLRLALIERLISTLDRVREETNDRVQIAPGISAESVVATCITGLRALAVHDWQEFFETASLVDAVLRQDPAGVYAAMDFASRDRTRKAVEEIARGSGRTELEVAQAALERARAARGPGPLAERQRHVGAWLLEPAGRRGLEDSLGFRVHGADAARRALLARPTAWYLGAIGVLSAAVVAAVGLLAAAGGIGWIVLAALLSVIPALGAAVGIVNAAVTRLLRPRVLPRLSLEDGIPPELSTIVAVPALITSEEEAMQLVDQLELHYLRNPEPELTFVLLSDVADAPDKVVDGDAGLVAAARGRIAALNARWNEQGGYFVLLHRDRTWNPAEGVWMGHERKRGKLEQLNRLVLAGELDPFPAREGPVERLRRARFVITLDADTILPRDGARTLVATLGHVLNRPVIGARGALLAGATILQPRTEIEPAQAARSRFTRLLAGATGLDPYTLAVSDAYQDLFGEGSFVGKGIYDVAAFDACLAGRVPDNTLLSHDLLEGLYARAALVTDVVVIEDLPPHYLAWAARTHRWIRGDWQLLPWFRAAVPHPGERRSPNPLSLIDRWKIVDNLRRSLHQPALLALLVAGWTLLPGSPLAWTLAAVVLAGAPHLVELATALPGLRYRTRQRAVVAAGASVSRWLLALALLPFEALLALDAILRTLVRLAITRRHLLEWRSAAHAARSGGGRLDTRMAWNRMAAAPALSFLVAALMTALRPGALPAAAPLLLAWLLSPQLAVWLSRPIRAALRPALSAREREHARLLARRTWLFFEAFVGPEDNWLPPDNFQESPLGVVGHRTSPTNIGLALLSTLAARDLGFIGLLELETRLAAAVATLRRLERHHGHPLNWFDTRTLAPLPPRYVSTVDSGNLAACLLALATGCRQVTDEPVVAVACGPGLADTLGLLAAFVSDVETGPGTSAARSLRVRIAELRDRAESVAGAREWHRFLAALQDDLAERLEADLLALAEAGGDQLGAERLQTLRQLAGRVRAHVNAARRELEATMPWLALLATPPDALASDRLAALEAALPDDLTLRATPGACAAATAALGGIEAMPAQARAWCEELRGALTTASASAERLLASFDAIATDCRALVDEMDFSLLYDRRRHLFHIGHNVDLGRLDANHYDLLASEARIASLLAIAKGDVPQRHWLHLARPVTEIDRRRVLLSWSGTMFEYLMPLLVLKSFPGTLLHESALGAIERQRSHGREHRVPWGVSESAYSRLDAASYYQYRAFGVPGLGYKRGLGEDMVVAPYASALAVQLVPGEALENLAQLEKLGMVGRWGLYESIDFTARRLALGERHVMVRAYMAHHQGMILTALVNVLRDDVMVERFHADPLVASVELLLQEALPLDAPLERPHADDLGGPREERARVSLHRWKVSVPGRSPSAHLLSNGRLSVVMTAAGAGFARLGPVALTRFRPDATREEHGCFVYVQDLETSEVNSPTAQPFGDASGCEVEMAPHSARCFRSTARLSLELEVTVAPDDDVELRRVTLVNLSDEPRRLRVVTFAEIALAEVAADHRHQAFTKLFVESAWDAEAGALIFRRRPRSAREEPVLLGHALIGEDGPAASGYEADRARFFGRYGSARRPQALANGAPLSGTVGATLDPCAALETELTLPAHGSAHIAVVTAAARTRAGLDEVLARHRSLRAVDRGFERSQAAASLALRRLGLDSDRLERIDRLLALLLMPHESLRSPSEELAANEKGQSGLWAYGISGDFPILLTRVAAADDLRLVHELLQAHAFWRQRGIAVDLVIENLEETTYGQELGGRLHRLINRRDAEAWLGRRGGIFVLVADHMPAPDRTLLASAARVVLDAGRGTLAEQVGGLERGRAPLPPLLRTRVAEDVDATEPVGRPEGLRFDNGFGGFSAEGDEYVIVAEPGAPTPAPWINVVATPAAGFTVSEAGSGMSWVANSGENRLTAWNNDPVQDTPSEVVYLRDEETTEVWTPTPLPAGAPTRHVVRHGAGFTSFESASHELAQTVRLLVAPDAPVKIVDVEVKNLASHGRRLTVTFFAEWVLGVSREGAAYVIPDYDGGSQTLLARNPFSPELPGHVAFAAASRPLHGLTTDREEFLGRLGEHRAPAALGRVGLTGRVEAGADQCAALQVHLDLPPGATERVHFLIGQAPDREQALALVERYRGEEAVTAAAEVRQRWDALLGAVQVRTPDTSFDLLANRFLLYQAIACRLWGRSALYQSSGAFGFRDQLQDVLALSLAAPEEARAHLLRAAARQFEEGDVLHWWHPPSGRGVRTRFADDLLWLPYVTARYVEATGDDGVLDEPVASLRAEPLGPEEEERFGLFPAGPEATLFEHCRRALECGYTTGERGLPLFGAGDWNDGMNRVGIEGRGESVWLAWFYGATALGFAVLAERRGELALAAELRGRAAGFAEAAERHAWDGAWYRRGTYDDGTPLGTAAAKEAQIDSIAQSWAVLSGLADDGRARQAMASVRTRLVRDHDRLIQLLDPPFDRTPHDPGYIKGYLPGIRENGAQYTHAAIWVVWAFAALGDGDEAFRLFSLLNPIRHAETTAGARRYMVEPYVIAADVYALAPHIGRGGWTWYTGSASWLYRVGVEAILGLRRQGEELVIDPCIPSSWPGFEATIRVGGSTYTIRVDNPDRICRGIARLRLDGRALEGSRIPLADDGRAHEVEALLTQVEPARTPRR